VSRSLRERERPALLFRLELLVEEPEVQPLR